MVLLNGIRTCDGIFLKICIQQRVLAREIKIVNKLQGSKPAGIIGTRKLHNNTDQMKTI